MLINLLRLLFFLFLLLTSSVSQNTTKRIDRIREWLQWDVECKFLPPAEQEIRWAQGRCPPLSSTVPATIETTTRWRRPWWKKKKISKKTLILRKKQKLLSIFSASGQARFEIDLNIDHGEWKVIAGAMLIITCDLAAHGKYNDEIEQISWFVNTNPIEVGIVDWRILIGEKQELIIWPVQEDDEGQFECTVNGLPRASGLIEVVNHREALFSGLANYLITAGIFLLLGLFIVIYKQGSVLTPPVKSSRQDRMADFLEQQIMENRTAVKENIAKIVHGEAFEKRKKEIEKSASRMPGVNASIRGNKDTIMTILVPPDEGPTQIRTSLRQTISRPSLRL